MERNGRAGSHFVIAYEHDQWFGQTYEPAGRQMVMVRRLNVTYELVVSTLVKGVCILWILLESSRVRIIENLRTKVL